MRNLSHEKIFDKDLVRNKFNHPNHTLYSRAHGQKTGDGRHEETRQEYKQSK